MLSALGFSLLRAGTLIQAFVTRIAGCAANAGLVSLCEALRALRRFRELSEAA
ncbi:hypothetical protein [Yersinia bercovieri]|uniref:hypothetical protein n=1 Tax=Yersinia bercovieri TaxID=634 RepID=UPI001643C3BE|nr:hypothetical protein [Yersinia bercovieri]